MTGLLLALVVATATPPPTRYVVELPPGVQVPTFEESIELDGPELDSSRYPECNEGDWHDARQYCMSHGQGYPLQNYSCEVLSNGHAHYICNYQIPGPYNPPVEPGRYYPVVY